MKASAPSNTVCCHDGHEGPSAGLRLGVFLQAGFVAFLLVLAVFFRQAPEFTTFSISFVAIFLEALPFMLLGAVIGGLIEVFVSRTVITRVLPNGRLPAILLAAGLGLFFPVCECAIIPVIRRLFAKGLPLGAGIAFLLGAPIVNPLVFLSTAVAYGNDVRMAGLRLAGGYLIAVVVGLLMDRLFARQSALVRFGVEQPTHDHGACDPTTPAGFATKISWAIRHAAADFIDVSRFLVFGAVAAGMLQALVARGQLAALTGSPVVSILAMMVLAIVLSLCSEADAFVAASFRSTLPFSAQMAFMVLGPMLDLKLIAMYFRVFTKRLIFTLSTASFLVVLLAMLCVQWMGW